jgi:hypothetical protein
MLTTELQSISFDEETSLVEVYVDYAIKSETLEPEAVTTTLGLQPSRFWMKGEEYIGRTWDPAKRRVSEARRQRTFGIWALDSKALKDTWRVERHIEFLLTQLEPRQADIRQFVELADEVSVSFFIWCEPGSGHGSYEITSRTLARMAALCQYTIFSFLG